MDNNFKKLEEQGRTLLFNYFLENDKGVWNIKFEPNQFERTDLVYYSGASTATAELKTRDYSYLKVWSGMPLGWIIEKQKFDELIQKSKLNHSQAIYICLFKDAILIWNLTQMNITWENKLCWSDHTCTKKVPKDVSYLPIESASHTFLYNFPLQSTKNI